MFEKRLTSILLQFGLSLDWHRLVLSLRLSIIQFCDNNVSDQLVLQCKISCADFQALQLYTFTALTRNELCFALSIFQVSGKQIHDIKAPASQFSES